MLVGPVLVEPAEDAARARSLRLSLIVDGARRRAAQVAAKQRAIASVAEDTRPQWARLHRDRRRALRAGGASLTTRRM
ncbi:hypothetical protein [Sorangium sp. So ce1153]|uniref:hypothetical protein n=1 Tax=Sorangium sp. So ce1153 TaxID=3133333 RepID=UPI003F60336D